jgi:hypothetical protein
MAARFWKTAYGMRLNCDFFPDPGDWVGGFFSASFVLTLFMKYTGTLFLISNCHEQSRTF